MDWMRLFRLACVAVVLCAISAGAGTGDPAPARPIEAVVDQFIDERLREDGVTAAPAADDATILRRLTLDLAGRIPTVGELDAYISSTDPDKKTQLVDRLMASPGFVRHQAAEFDRLLMGGNGGFVAEREVGVVKFLTTKGVSRDARLMFLTGTAVDTPTLREPTAEERKRDKELFDGFKSRKAAPPRPSFSARAQLVELSLRPDQRGFFAKAIVNRVWHRLFGRGLVMPLDQMHAENPPSHPELPGGLA